MWTIGGAVQVRNIEENAAADAVTDPAGVPLPPCIVMERGESLDRWSARNRPDMWQSVTVRPPPHACTYDSYYVTMNAPAVLYVPGDHGTHAPGGAAYIEKFRIVLSIFEVFAPTIRRDRVCVPQTIMHIAERLEALHAAGYVHRDLKPSNVIWLSRRNRWTVIDFGCVAEIGAPCRAAFSLPYVAPETLRAHAQKSALTASVAVDAWSLGVMFFELLTGRQWYKLLEDRNMV